MITVGTGEQMAHTMIASKAVERMFESDDEFNGLKIAIEHDFMGSCSHPLAVSFTYSR